MNTENAAALAVAASLVEALLPFPLSLPSSKCTPHWKGKQMRQVFVMLAIGVLALVSGGCGVKSLHPLATPETTITDPRLEGRWSLAKPLKDGEIAKPEDREYFGEVEIDALRSGEYDLTLYTNGDHDEGDQPDLKVNFFKMRIVRLGAARYIEMRTSKPDCSPFAIGTYEFWRIEQGDTRHMLSMLSGDWLRDRRDAGLPCMGLTQIEKDQVADFEWLLTAETAELQSFLRIHGEEDGIFQPLFEAKRIKEGETIFKTKKPQPRKK
jgi:hypothetical protein